MRLATVEEALETPADEWVGRCYEIATMIVEAGLCPPGARAVYGHWLGGVSATCAVPGWRGRSLVRHGWVLLPDQSVIDPTRWVFEDAPPYIYVGPNCGAYDEGGQELRRELMQPAPQYSSEPLEEEDWSLETKLQGLSSPAWVHLFRLMGIPDDHGYLEISQLMWLANQVPGDLAPHAREFYEALAREGRASLIPLDHRLMVLGK